MAQEKHIPVAVSLTEAERAKLTSWAKHYGLSLSAFLRIAAQEYIVNHKLD